MKKLKQGRQGFMSYVNILTGKQTWKEGIQDKEYAKIYVQNIMQKIQNPKIPCEGFCGKYALIRAVRPTAVEEGGLDSGCDFWYCGEHFWGQILSPRRTGPPAYLLGWGPLKQPYMTQSTLSPPPPPRLTNATPFCVMKPKKHKYTVITTNIWSVMQWQEVNK